MKLKILMVDDHTLFRDGMRYVLQQLASEVEVIDADNFLAGLKLAEAHADIDLALLDLHMPGSNGVQSIQVFSRSHPDIPLVVVSGSDQRGDIEKVLECGAMGFISKMSPSKIMLAALRMVLDGGVYLPPQLLQQINPDAQSSASDPQYQSILTQRQMQTLALLADGLSNKEIAAQLNLAEGTVKIHTAGVYQALNVNSRLEAVQVARRMGLINQIKSDSYAK